MKYLLLQIILFLAFSSALSQKTQNSIVFSNSQTQYFLVKYDEFKGKESSIKNYFIEQISNSIPKILKYTNYQVEFTEKLTIVEKSDHIYELRIHFKDIKTSGDIFYKEIFVGDVIYPNIYGYVLHVFNGSKLIKEVLIPTARFTGSNEYFHRITFQDKSKTKEFKAFTVTKRINYDQESLDNFNSRLNLIREYYSYNTTLLMLQDKLNAIDFSITDMIPVYKFRLKDIQNQMSKIDSISFPDRLNLSLSDPLQFIRRKEEISSKIDKLNLLTEQYLKSMDFWYFKLGLENLNKQDTIAAIKYFIRSLDMNPYYPQTHYQLAKIDLNKGRLHDASIRIQIVLDRVTKDEPYLELFFELDNIFLQKYLDSAYILMDSALYQQALKILNDADSLCRIKKHLHCPINLSNHIAESKQGVYQSFLTIARRAAESNRLDLSERYIDVARKYQQKSSTEILNTSAIDELLQWIVNSYRTKGLQALGNNSYMDAYDYFDKCLDFCNKYPQLNCDDQIINGLLKAENKLNRGY
ncbi:tetratricopeptide repeat protein [Bacteroidota bacterium]